MISNVEEEGLFKDKIKDLKDCLEFRVEIGMWKFLSFWFYLVYRKR